MMKQLLRFAILDDDEEDFILFRDVIEDAYGKNYELNYFSTFEHFHASLENNSPDLCFIDYKLGAMLGTQIIADLNKSHPYLPCILLTGLSDLKIDLEASQSGAYEYLPKEGLDPQLLERTIRYVLKNAEQRNQLAEERYRLELVISESPYPTMFYSESGNFRTVSDSLFDLCGLKNEKITSIDQWLERVYSEQPDKINSFKRQLIKSVGSSPINGVIKHSNRSKMLWRFKTVEIGESKNEERLFVTVASDITKLTDALRRAEAANRAKTDFLSVISHELRTPLNPILGLTDIIKEEVEDSNILEMIEIIQNSAQGLLRLIQDLLDYTNTDRETFKLVKKPFSLKSVIDDSVATLNNNFNARDIELTVSYKDLEMDFQKNAYIGDAGRIQQIILNLLNNALKFTTQGSVTISISCDKREQSQQTIVFEIADTGMGISTEDQKFIFDPLYQVDSSSTRTQQGVGLGLAICKRLIFQMGGEIKVQSELGKGTCFTFKVPFEIEDIRKEIPEKEKLQKPFEASCKILVVEDVSVNMLFMRCILKRFGLEVIEATNGQEAIDHFKSDPHGIDLILMDLQMPICDGYEATQTIRKHREAGNKVPILAITANANPGTEAACLKAGMNGFLTKPLKPSKLGDILNKFIDTSLQRAQS